MLFLAAVLVLVTVCLLGDFLRRPRSSSIRLPHQLQIYAIHRVLDLIGAYYGRAMERDTRNFMKVQRELISTILRVGERTQYGRDHGLGQMRTLSDFRSQHPVTEYRHYAAYIRSVEHGDESAMLGDDEVKFFVNSSGTTDANKHLPMGHKQFKRCLRYCAVLTAKTESVYGDSVIARALMVTTRVKPAVSVSGKQITSLSPRLQQQSALVRLRSVTPPCVEEVETETDACYLGVLFALREKEMYAVYCSFVYVFLRLMSILETHWPRLVSEIAAGRIGDHLSVSDSLLKRINAHLTPAPDRAKELEQIFLEGFDGIVPRVWSKLRFVQAARSGLGAEMYSKLTNRFLGGVPVLDLAYACSETWLGHSREPTAPDTTFTLLADSCLYEFLPMECTGAEEETRHEWTGTRPRSGTDNGPLHRRGEATPALRGDDDVLQHGLGGGNKRKQTVQMPHQTCKEEEGPEDLRHRLLLSDEVQVGCDYELVITTRCGLYRYRQGDVVRVRDFHNQAPVVELLYRANASLYIATVKASSLVLFRALQAAAARWPGRTVLEFAAASSALDLASSAERPHILLFLELTGPRLSEEEASLVELYFQSAFGYYSLSRQLEKVGPLRVLQTVPGAFLKLRDSTASRVKAHWSQLKTKHVLREPEDVAFLMTQLLPPGQ